MLDLLLLTRGKYPIKISIKYETNPGHGVFSELEPLMRNMSERVLFCFVLFCLPHFFRLNLVLLDIVRV